MRPTSSYISPHASHAGVVEEGTIPLKSYLRTPGPLHIFQACTDHASFQAARCIHDLSGCFVGKWAIIPGVIHGGVSELHMHTRTPTPIASQVVVEGPRVQGLCRLHGVSECCWSHLEGTDGEKASHADAYVWFPRFRELSITMRVVGSILWGVKLVVTVDSYLWKYSEIPTLYCRSLRLSPAPLKP